MGIRKYEELTEEEVDKLADMWIKISDGLRFYEDITGARGLDDEVNDFIWVSITYQANNEEE